MALARGFSVWSSDWDKRSAWQRKTSAEASFGIQSKEVLRLKLPTVDVVNESTWPKVRFDVIALVQPDTVVRLCEGFRELLRKRLDHPFGVGLYLRRLYFDSDLGSSADRECFWPDGSELLSQCTR